MKVPLPILARLARDAPDLLAAILRDSLRGRYAARFDYHRRGGRACLPRYVFIKLTNRCNLRCAMCGQWGTRGTAREMSPAELHQVLPVAVLKRLIDEVSTWGALLYLWGGEPFLYPHLVELLEHLQRRRVVCGINTNGTYLWRYAEDLVRCGVANLFVSLDGPREIHDAVRGRRGTFDLLVRGIERVQALKAAGSNGRKARPFITIVATVSETNCRHLEGVYEVAARLRADFVGLQFSTFTDKAHGEAHEALMRQHLASEARSWRGFVSDTSGIDVAAVQRAVADVRARRHPFATYFLPRLRTDQMPVYYRDLDQTFGRRRCVVPWVRADVSPAGNVSVCSDFPDYVAGNIKEQTLRTIWNGQRMRRFRKVARKGLFPICSRCCALYQY